MTNTTTIAAVATFAFSHGGEVKAIIYTNGKVTTHVCGRSPDGGRSNFSSLGEVLSGSFEPGSFERAFAYAAAYALLPAGRPGWWYSRKARDLMGWEEEAGDLMAGLVIDWAL